MAMISYVVRSIAKNKARSAFTFISIAAAFVLATLLLAFESSMSAGVSVAGADRLITMHRLSFAHTIPLAHLDRIRQLDGVKDAEPFLWFGAYNQEPRNQFGLFPTNIEKLPALYPEYKLSSGDWDSLLKSRAGLLVGEELMQLWGWKLGQRVSVGSSIYPQKDGNPFWEFEILGTFKAETATEELQAFSHAAYHQEAAAYGGGSTNWIISTLEQLGSADIVSAQIDTAFENSFSETRTSSEKAWVAGFMGQFANIGFIVTSIGAVVFFTLLLMVGNSMANSIRERTKDIGVLKTLGFSSTRILLLVIGEGLMIALSGGLVGIVFGWLIVQALGVGLSGFLPGFALGTDSVVIAFCFALALGVAASLLPAVRAMRVDIVSALARRT